MGTFRLVKLTSSNSNGRSVAVNPDHARYLGVPAFDRTGRAIEIGLGGADKICVEGTLNEVATLLGSQIATV